MPSQLQRIKGRFFLKPVILRKDVHIVISQQVEASNGTQWKADSLDGLLTFDEEAMNTSSIAFYSSRTFLVQSTNYFHSYTPQCLSTQREGVRCSVSGVLDIT